MLSTRKVERELKKLDRQKGNGLVRTARHLAIGSLSLRGILAVALATLALFAILMVLEPIRSAWDWVQGVGQNIGQIILPDEELTLQAEQVFAANFQDESLLGEASADITAENLRTVRQSGLFGWGTSEFSEDSVVATARWVVRWQGVVIDDSLGRLTVSLPEAELDGVWVLAQELPMPEYDANWATRLADVFNGVESPDDFRNHLQSVLEDEAAEHSAYLKSRAEAAAARTITELLQEQGIEVHVVFDG